jgi:single-strand DNA-binding protein
MAGYNRVVLMGNLTRDPDYKQLSSGQAVCRLGLASNRQFRNKQSGAMVQEVCYIDVDVWGPQAESCRQFLQKGRPVLVEGRLKFDTWEDADGKMRSKHAIVADRVVFLGSAQAIEEEGTEPEAPRLDPDIDQALKTQLAEVKTRTQVKSAVASQPKVKKAGAPAVAEGSAVAFTDEPPFQDDLPF